MNVFSGTGRLGSQHGCGKPLGVLRASDFNCLYSPYETRLLRLRSRYLNEVTQFLPTPLRSLGLAPEHLFGQRRFLGEYYCMWIADALDYREDMKIENLGVATVFARAYAVIQDKIADQEDVPNHSIVHLGPIFLQRSLAAFSSQVDNQNIFWKYAEYYLRETARTDFYERKRHWNRLADFTEEDIKVLGRKTSICFLPAAVLAICSGQTSVIPSLEELIAARNVAIQIRDDLADWRKDLAADNFTLPVSLSLYLAGIREKEEIKEISSTGQLQEIVATHLYGTGVAEILIDLSNLYLERAAAEEIIERGPLTIYFRRLIWSNLRIKDKLKALGKTYGLKFPEGLSVKSVGKPWPRISLNESMSQPRLLKPLRRDVVREFDRVMNRLHPRAGVT